MQNKKEKRKRYKCKKVAPFLIRYRKKGGKSTSQKFGLMSRVGYRGRHTSWCRPKNRLKTNRNDFENSCPFILCTIDKLLCHTQDKKRARIEKLFLSFFTLKSQLAIKIFLVQTPPKIVHAQYCSKSLKKGQKQECMCNYLPVFWKNFFSIRRHQGSFFYKPLRKILRSLQKFILFFKIKKLKARWMCVPPFKIAFYHLGAMVHIETNCYNTSRFFSRKFMCVHELYIFFNQKILHFKKTHTHKL